MGDLVEITDEVVPLAGLEPARLGRQQILSLSRLPIPPQRHRTPFTLYFNKTQVLTS